MRLQTNHNPGFFFKTRIFLSLLLFFAIGIISAYAQPSNDNFASAIDVTGIINSCSSDAQYTTLNGTADLNAGSCWNNSGPQLNVWFSFTAPASGEINITIDIGGSKGTQRRTQLAIWQSDGTTEVACDRYTSTNGDIVVLGSTGLTPTSTYYISVDAFNASYDGTFTLCLDDAVDYDFFEGATDLTGIINSCSSDAQYTTIGASPDQNAGSCWNNSGPQLNRWFSFTAPASGLINVTVDVDGTKGTQRRSQVALWESDGTTEIECSRYTSSNNDDVVIGTTGLTPGNTYYISVDAFNTSYDGTFTICLDDQVDYDFYEGAIDVTGLINSCSTDGQFTTIGASPDRNAGSCWNNAGPQLNRWFSFTAPAGGLINVTVDVGGTKGTQRRTQLALWESDGTTEVECARYTSTNSDDVIIGATGLTPGNTYYLSVDAFNTSYDGTFTLCLDDQVDYDFYEGAIDVTGLINSCSTDGQYTTIGASPDRNAGSCWNNAGPQLNRWFFFTAPASGLMSITVDVGGTKGTQRRSQVALWEADGTTEVICGRYTSSNDDDVVIGTTGLTPGNTYYISVDAFNTSYDGTFTLCLEDAVDYDFYEGAIDVTGLINSCSSDGEYTTIGASPDRNAGSCWNNAGPQLNRWFSFTAPASGLINITVDIGGTMGTQRRTQMALWESDGTTEVECSRYTSTNSDDVIIGATGLTPGNTYYISIDAFNTSYDGTFTLCLDDQVDYDFYEGAIDVTSLINNCSADARYTTIGASSDLNAGSCWNNAGPQLNRWFLFTAPASGRINVTVDVGGTKGTQRRTQLALWESDGTTEVECGRYTSTNSDDVIVGNTSLTPGNTYYISVDAFNTSYDGTFTLCLDDQVDYDFYEGAIELTDLNNFCSADAEYTTIGASADLNAGSCWNNSGPQLNRWYTFLAPASGVINIRVDVGGTKGTQRRTQLALWESDGTTEVECARYTSSNDDDVVLGTTGLTPGNRYYISVDAFNTSYDGTFTLCVDDELDYDYYEGAIELTDLNNWCSADAEFTTIGGSPDLNAGSCWNNSGPRLNRWFFFTALTSDATITVDIDGTKGTQRRTQLALWESDGTTEVDCQLYSSNNDDLTISTTSLVPGNVYYISVDAFNTSYDGTFTLCVDNVDETYYSITSGSWNDGNNWSFTSHAGAAAGDYPQAGDIALIEGHVMTITGTETIAQVDINAATNISGVTISNGNLTVAGQFNMTNTGNNINIITTISNGTLTVNDNFTMNRNGGTSTITNNITNSTVNINGDMDLNSTVGTGDNTFTISNSSNVTVTGEVNMNNTGGPRTLITIDNADLTLEDNLNFTASADNLVEISLTNTADLFLEHNISRGTPAYGDISSSGNSIIHYSSSNNIQTLASTDGSGTGDAISYENLIINNSRLTIPQVILGGDVNITGTMTLTDGVVSSTSSNLLTINDGATLSGGSAASYVDGPLRKIGAGDFTFQIGDDSQWAPLDIANLTGDAATEFTAEYLQSSYGDITNYRTPDPNGDLTNVSAIEYWNLDQSGTSSNADLTLHWKDQSASFIDNYTDLQIVHYNTISSEWENLGQTSIVSADPGSITVTGVSSFSPFTFGSTTLLSNPLPVEFLNFSANIENDDVLLEWSTASEINNDYFSIQRSVDGETFETLELVEGAGNSNQVLEYRYLDRNPLAGLSYYRIMQTDFDGAFDFSRTLSVSLDASSIEQITIFPNPAKENYFEISINGNSKQPVKVTLYNVLGESVQTFEITETNGVMKQTVPINLAPGIYMIVGEGGPFNSFKKKLIVQ